LYVVSCYSQICRVTNEKTHQREKHLGAGQKLKPSFKENYALNPVCSGVSQMSQEIKDSGGLARLIAPNRTLLAEDDGSYLRGLSDQIRNYILGFSC